MKRVMSLAPGTRLGPYELLALIGAGGMGEVYRARDTRLDRTVAIKILQDRFSERFEREARAVALLNHPHICTLHDVGPNYLVLELLDGEPLDVRLKRGPLPLHQTLRCGAQIASALAAAHNAGIVHRDLKPGNIMLTKTGAKVLDFGLAKMATEQTLTMANTVLGTPAYMAPEQREGKEVDARADIYSLGLVLREMATGKRDTATIQPPYLARIIDTCLKEDLEDRWQSAADIQKQLEWIPPEGASSKPTRLPWIFAATTFLALLASNIAWYRARQSAMNAGPSEFSISLERESGSLPVPSPDGRLLAFHGLDSNGRAAVWLRPINAVSAHALEGTEGAGATIFWSARGDWIGFFASGAMKKVRVTGGLPISIAEMPDLQDADWSPQGDIIFRMRNREPLMRVRDSGGTPQQLTQLNEARRENSHRYPQFLPGGKRFLFVTRCSERANNALYIGSLDGPDVTRIMPAQARVFYFNGALLYYLDGALVSQNFDIRTGQVSGDPAVVVAKVGYRAASIQASFRVSSDGKVIVSRIGDDLTARLVWFSRSGQEIGTTGPPSPYHQPRLSPSGDRLLFNMPDPKSGNRDLWFIELKRDITYRLTTNVANDWYAVWSPDGKQVIFGSDRLDGRTMVAFIKTSLDQDAAEVRVEGLTQPADWSRDGWISGGDGDLWIARIKGGKPFEFVATPALEFEPRFSPDSKWIAYSSDESGRPEIYVQPFAGAPASPATKIQVSNNGGEFPVWNASGTELYYMSSDDAIYAVDTRGLPAGRTLPAPVRLFKACPGTRPSAPALSGSPYAAGFDTRDGQKFIVPCSAERSGQYTVLMNWAGMSP
jgi:Tol biopolymer transport system component